MCASPTTALESVIFLKLGGSLITNKNVPFTPQTKRLKRIAREIKNAVEQQTHLRLIIGHGSGSFGHVAAQKYNTRLGVHSQEEWKGFAEVWMQARRLNQIVIEAFYQQGLPVLAFPPSASVIARNGTVLTWDTSALSRALEKGIIPIIQGDVIFDDVLGGTILSTEELFLSLAERIHTTRLILAGNEDGVWKDFPHRHQLIKRITPENLSGFASGNFTSYAFDVTGGMLKKVEKMIEFVQQDPSRQALIFSGIKRGNIARALMGDNPGTLILQG